MIKSGNTQAAIGAGICRRCCSLNSEKWYNIAPPNRSIRDKTYPDDDPSDPDGDPSDPDGDPGDPDGDPGDPDDDPSDPDDDPSAPASESVTLRVLFYTQAEGGLSYDASTFHRTHAGQSLAQVVRSR